MATINGLTTLAVADVTASDFLPIYDASAGTDKKTALFETGTWTPALAFSGSTTGITYSTQSGQYIRIGDVLSVAFDIVLTSKGTHAAGATATITGLPGTAAGAVMWGNGAHYASGFSGVSSLPSGYVTSAIIVLLHFTTGIASLTYSEFTNSTRLSMTITFREA